MRARWREPLVRFGAAGLLGAGAVFTVIYRGAYRQLETVAAGGASRGLTSGRALINRHTDTFFLHVGTPKVFGVVVTPICSSAVISAVVLAVTGLVVASSRFSVSRALLAALAAAGGFAVLNLGRLVIIAMASDRWGIGAGYRWSHEWVGTFLTVFGGVIAAVVYLVVLGGRHRARAAG